MLLARNALALLTILMLEFVGALLPQDILQHTLHFARSNIRNIACVNIRLSIACRASHLRSIIVWKPLMATLYPTLYRHRLIHLYFYVCHRVF